MAAEKTKNPPPPAEPYTNIEMRLVCADSFRVRNTGKVITWKPDMLRVYLYLFDQCQGFENSGGQFFQKREKIWKCCGVSRDRLDKILKALLQLGLIKDTGKRRTAPGAPRGMVVYTAFRLMDVIENLEIIFADDNGEPVWDHDRASGKKKSKKSREKRQHGESEMQIPTDGPTNQPAAAPADQNPDLAAGSAAPSVVGQRDRVASDNNSGGNNGPDDDHAVNPAEEQEKGQAYHFPWKGDTFIKNRLSENAFQWALTAGATDWHHACRLVWEKIEVAPPTEIDECYKPLSLC